jgi:hypothetical protein
MPTQVGRRVLQHFCTRYLTTALDAWRCWYQRKAYLAAVFAQLQGKGHKQVRGARHLFLLAPALNLLAMLSAADLCSLPVRWLRNGPCLWRFALTCR